MSGRPPLYCPFCADQDLWPSEQDEAAWECRSCTRAFTIRTLGTSKPNGVSS